MEKEDTKAVILAAGQGTRMRPLTENHAKPMLPVAGKPIVRHNVELVEDTVDEVILVGGYRIEELREEFDSENVRIVEQEEALGTAHAALQAKKYIDSKTVIMNGDDIYGEKAVEAIQEDSAVLASKVDDPGKYGIYRMEGNGDVTGIVEKPDDPPSRMANIGFYVVQPEFYEMLEEVEKSERGEYEITDPLDKYIESHDVTLVEAERWLPCSYPFQLLNANRRLLEDDVESNSLVLEADVDGESAVKGSTVHPGAVVKGDVKNSIIMENATIKEGVEVRNSVILPDATVTEDRTEEEKNAEGVTVDRDEPGLDL